MKTQTRDLKELFNAKNIRHITYYLSKHEDIFKKLNTAEQEFIIAIGLCVADDKEISDFELGVYAGIIIGIDLPVLKTMTESVH
jgi:hypothetical protein